MRANRAPFTLSIASCDAALRNGGWTSPSRTSSRGPLFPREGSTMHWTSTTHGCRDRIDVKRRESQIAHRKKVFERSRARLEADISPLIALIDAEPAKMLCAVHYRLLPGVALASRLDAP